MTEFLDNPAGRIAATLRDVQKLGDGPAFSIWAQALGAGNGGVAFRNIGKFMDLVDEAKNAVIKLDEQELSPAFYLSAFAFLDELVSRLTTHLGDGDMAAFKPYLSDERIVLVEMLSQILRRSYRSAILSEGARNEMLRDVRELIDTVLQNDSFSTYEKSYIVKLLRDIEEALLSYWLGGFDDVASSVTAAAASIAVVSNVAQRGWLTTQLGRLWDFVTSKSEGTKAIAAAGKEVVTLIDSVDKLTQ